MNISPWWTALAIGIGGGCGSVLRWLATLLLSPLGWPVAAGTLAVNLMGGLLIGLAMVWFGRHPDEFWRLVLVTGLLGGLTTFSAFSAESLALLLRGDWLLALGHTLLHVLGALAAAALGWALGQWCWAAGA